ncbi:winged helix-turn-helix domain-containing protein [Variovorax sp. J31P207]|uniref:winged helix-turn-helix domain-containing tetratricopeptide repeat protein n=1 Tax=Variovorax sp. J31P207 TaxID=3053510 RepID=UPI0025750029|nr:winged helix-turn-helix domain-containing protein [Variovorax sp. J31P207]MDM0069654.1 winged helix-turn-helix domain-containing protein [Variovorax sp. J31P207]
MNDERSTINHRIGDGPPMGAPDAVGDGIAAFAGFEFDSRRDELRKDGVAISMRPKPRALLRHLLDHPGRLLGKEELIRALWGSVVVGDDSLVQCVGELRAALGDRGVLIKTLPRRGYMLDTTVERLATRPQELPQPEPAMDGPKRTSRNPDRRWWLVPFICALLLGVAGAVWKIRQPPPLRIDDELTARHAVAVLPLVDADAPGGTSVLGNALADDISAQISLRHGMRVIGPASTARYNAPAPDIAQIGRELGVRYVIGGRVTRDGGAIVIDSTLTSVETGEVIRLNRSTFPTPADVQHSNLDQRVASAFRMQFFEIDNVRANRPGHVVDAADLTSLGWRDLNRFATRDDVLRARSRFEAALKVDPDSVAALQGVGSSYQIEIASYFSRDPQSLVEPGKKALKRAMELRPDVPENLLPWGSLLGLSGQLAEAMAMYKKALEISPNYAFAHLFVARQLIWEGRFAEAQQEIDKARGLSPADARLLYAVYSLSAIANFVQGRDDEAYRWAMRWVAEYPNSGQPYAMLAAIDALRGHDAEAAAHMARHRELLPNDSIAYVVFLSPSTDPVFLAQRARLIEGLRKAGLPDG